jgi:RNA polymerase sigma-70 factor (ECF subfamily)
MIARAELTRTLNGLSSAPNPAAADSLLPLVYTELRDLAGRYFNGERQDHILQPTELVHEAYVRMVDLTKIEWQGRTHFYAIGATTMRRILVEQARKRDRKKRGGDPERVSLEDGLALSKEKSVDVLAVEEALQELESNDPRAAKVIEMKFFGGMTEVEIAEKLDVSRRTVQNEWRLAKAWLRKFLSDYG